MFPATLHGGPFDGDSGLWNGPELPPVIWAYEWPACPALAVHWTADPIVAAERGAEKYIFDRIEGDLAHVAVYVYAELDYDGILRDESEKAHA